MATIAKSADWFKRHFGAKSPSLAGYRRLTRDELVQAGFGPSAVRYGKPTKSGKITPVAAKKSVSRHVFETAKITKAAKSATPLTPKKLAKKVKLQETRILTTGDVVENTYQLTWDGKPGYETVVNLEIEQIRKKYKNNPQAVARFVLVFKDGSGYGGTLYFLNEITAQKLENKINSDIARYASTPGKKSDIYRQIRYLELRVRTDI